MMFQSCVVRFDDVSIVRPTRVLSWVSSGAHWVAVLRAFQWHANSPPGRAQKRQQKLALTIKKLEKEIAAMLQEGKVDKARARAEQVTG